MVDPAPPRWALLALALALAFLAPTALAAADAADQAEDEGQRWSDEPRTVVAWPEGNGFVVRSTRESSLGQDEITATYDGAAARLQVVLEATEPQDGDIVVTLGLRALAEFRDIDGDGVLGPGDDVVRRIPLEGTPAVATTEALAGGGWRATATHALPAPPSAPGLAAPTPRLELVLEVRPTVDAGKEPTRLDVLARALDGWTRNGTHLALEATLDGDESPSDVGADAAHVDDGGLEIAMTWQDGRGTAAEGRAPESVDFVRSQSASHLVSFPLALSASWHPAARSTHAPGGNVLLYVGAAAFALAAVAIPAWRRLRA